MKICNIHERIINRPINQVGPILDSLSSTRDKLWPHEKWPPMKFDRELSEGAKGGHGPIRYYVKHYKPGKKVIFEFTGPSGFHGRHLFELEKKEPKSTIIRHTIDMKIKGQALFSWPMLFRPLHDALIEDSFDKLETNLTLFPKNSNWSSWVRILRWALKKGKIS
jgi:hypothetical protein